MKKYTAFFPGAQLNRIGQDEKEAFYLGILAYDTIYIRTFHLESLKKKELYADKNDLLKSDEDGCSLLDLNTYSLVEYYLNGDIETVRKLINKKILQNIYSLHSFNDNFIDDVFWYYYNNDKHSIFPSSELFLFVYNKLCNIYPEKIVKKILDGYKHYYRI
ncbi:hypothetical protein [Roseburia sp. 1XD42-69]|uniref:hypothetical protein n=1 Tax=Roseburia sp. 1XD42-69 TaxID=2320088 RepID=UPI000EA37C31|nr:hypothetical protein [Roseburia sp. 1XD42-69]RKJ68798.1 hypothetical protein D7Y06_00680 [Roseburia sp. 1XD42-69]